VPARVARGDRPLLVVAEADRYIVEDLGVRLRRLRQVGRWHVYEPA
jgi:hypothetical protein